jgi:hypothetical protein
VGIHHPYVRDVTYSKNHVSQFQRELAIFELCENSFAVLSNVKMENVVVHEKKKHSNGSSEKIKAIKNHEIAAYHFEKAAKYHHEAAVHHEAGNHKKASESTVKALGHHCLASEAQRDDVKHHASKKWD